MFALSGAVQRRTMKGYGQWVSANRLSKSQPLNQGPTAAHLIHVVCPPEIMLADRILDASVRLEGAVHVDYEATLHVPVSSLNVLLMW